MADDPYDFDDESEEERLTRNLNELLQELRVTQTGVQILTGFLLTLPFTNRFGSLDTVQRAAYLAVLCGSVIATGLIIAPVAFHRVLFRHGQRPWLVRAANWAARAGLVSLALTTSGVVWLVFDLVTDRTAASVAGVLSLIFFGTLWAVVPLRAPRSKDPTG
jgi:thiosulfate reductase cytochrome b subunit